MGKYEQLVLTTEASVCSTYTSLLWNIMSTPRGYKHLKGCEFGEQQLQWWDWADLGPRNSWKRANRGGLAVAVGLLHTLSGLNTDRIRIFLFHGKFQISLKSTNFEHVKILNSSLWKSKTEIRTTLCTIKNFEVQKKKYGLAAGTENIQKTGI